MLTDALKIDPLRGEALKANANALATNLRQQFIDATLARAPDFTPTEAAMIEGMALSILANSVAASVINYIGPENRVGALNAFIETLHGGLLRARPNILRLVRESEAAVDQCIGQVEQLEALLQAVGARTAALTRGAHAAKARPAPLPSESLGRFPPADPDARRRLGMRPLDDAAHDGLCHIVSDGEQFAIARWDLGRKEWIFPLTQLTIAGLIPTEYVP
ncbi:MAG TPA: hypothetical protein VFF98_17325 [Novosphingobium sp.]|nr:hypothetical protein [Novosphingobium sp.]HZV11309.1 hypothetical protein [Novosphingobium sp.]